MTKNSSTATGRRGRRATMAEIYQEGYKVMESFEGADREEFVALCPKVTAMERSFYRWR